MISSALIKNFLKDISPPKSRITKNKIALVEEVFLPLIHKHLHIDIDAEIFIPSEVMRSYVREYGIIRDACFVMKGYHNRQSGLCDRIIGYTPKFEALYFSILKNLAAIQLKNIKKKNNNSSSNRLSLVNNAFVPNLFPGACFDQYTTSDKSARLYHGAQNLPRHIKSVIYENCYDIDIINCHASIFYNELINNRQYVVNNDFKEMMEQPEKFLQRIIKSGVHHKIWLSFKRRMKSNDRSKAKFARSRLFYPPASGRKPRKTGIKWYDDLQQYILDIFRQEGIDNPHLWLTKHEQQIINKAIETLGKDKIALLMHDGMIVFEVSDYQETLDELHKETGYMWSIKNLE